MAALRSFSTILGPALQLWLLLFVRTHLAEHSFERIVGGRPNPMSQEAVTITAGKTLILVCILTQKDMPATAEWYKDLGNDQEIIYRESDKFSRGARLVPGSPIDFSVQLYNVGPEDSGTYCCLVVNEGPQSRNSIKTKSVVSVVAHPSQPLIRGPTDGIAVGSQVSFNCSAKEFPSQEITVIWLKDKEEIEPAGTDIWNYTTFEDIRYRLETTVKILLRPEDMGSVLSCQVRHSSLENSLQQDLVLGKVIRGSTQNSPTNLWIALFLNKAGVLLVISLLFVMKACKCNCARNPSRLSQEARQSGKSG
ncbi:tyrosine-protein phosphatase non-receptor type substrate 1-like [Erythrolamprus reginae]|uniref:tyrosine-protein phosphatase non-receptor type substrate 1-like n=1 Tax=Erythrolamprus reginae TaxID=121349 RepID=UPI00396C93E1